MPNTPERFSSPGRILPGCRLCSPKWNECEMDLTETDCGIVIKPRLGDIYWTRSLQKKDGQLQCSLQELEVLRCIAEDEAEATETAIRLGNLEIKHLPQSRYPCLFPHQADTAHSILEVVSGMDGKELLELGEEAIRCSSALLCPVRASTCKTPYHEGVQEEVYTLAVNWPLRQALYATPVEGMVDITPVAICRNDLLRDRCMVFDVGRDGARRQPIEIRMCTPPDWIGDTCSKWIPPYARYNADIAIHPSWQGNILNAIQPAVLQCQYRRATTQPTRLYDAHDRTTREDIRAEHYLALSYCWGQWPETSNHILEEKLKELFERLGIRYFWVDRWCVNQKNDEDKAREIPRMRDYYAGASACVVLPGPTVKPFECLPQHDGAILASFQQIMLNGVGLDSLLRCECATRVWTLQEALMSRQLIYAVQDQLIDGDYVSELIAYCETGSEQYEVNDDDPHDTHWIGGYGCYRWDVRAIPVVYPRQFRIREGSQLLLILRTVFGGEQQYKELRSQPHGISMPLEEALAVVQGRHATKQEDSIYGVLGITERGEEIEIEYEIDLPRMLDKLQHAGMMTERLLASPTVNKLPGKSWLPEGSSVSEILMNFERLAAFVLRPNLPWSQRGPTMLGVVFEWMEPEIVDGDRNNNHGLGCRVVRGKLWFPAVPGLIAEVKGTSGSLFTEQRLSGTHVMLCENVDKNTPDIVAIRVSGDFEGRNVRREDGYVLELHRWLEGDPRILAEKGSLWVIGSG